MYTPGKYCSLALLFLVALHCGALAQKQGIDRNLFFLDENLVEVSLTTDIKNLRSGKKAPKWQPASIEMKFNDTLIIKEQIALQPRGVTRKVICDIASLFLDFKTPASPKLSRLKKLKLVGGCRATRFDEELLMKEFLLYKMYNQLSVMSFRVRLLEVTYNDSKQKVKPYTQKAFLIEDIDEVAERNNCVEKNYQVYKAEQTNRRQIALVSIFEYMIGNTDFSIPNRHNVKLIVPKNDTFALPYPIPYDFDYAGLVNAPYAVPREELGISSVRDRLYRGFARTMAEIEPLVEIFNEKKETLYAMIMNFPYMKDGAKKEIITYLDGFYTILTSKRLIRETFVENVRTF